MTPGTLADRTEVRFAPTFTHRLYFTDDVLGRETDVLANVLEPSGERPARVQFWVDAHVAGAIPDLADRLVGFVSSFPGRVELAGAVEIVPGGEAVKNDLQLLERMLRSFYDQGLDRRSYVVVIGGGAVLDAVGFAAAVAHRGLRLVRLPTTTLGQADSGVGVKNAVNLFGKKNWLGSFAVPWAVINDAGLLDSLPDRDYRCGFSEAVKVSLLKDPVLFARICRDAGAIRRRDPIAALHVIRASAELHRDHITLGGDPFETREARPLDFGHWSAHRMEALTDFRLRHGEAVAIGVALDTIFSHKTLGLPVEDTLRVLTSLSDLGFPLNDPILDDPTPILEGLEEFRQHLGGRLTITLLKGVGKPVDVHEMDTEVVRESIEDLRRFASTQPDDLRSLKPDPTNPAPVISCRSQNPVD